MEIPNKATMDEWYDHPGTAYLLSAINARETWCIDDRDNAYCLGNPNLTQDLLSRSNGALDELIAFKQDISGKSIEGLMPPAELEDEE